MNRYVVPIQTGDGFEVTFLLPGQRFELCGDVFRTGELYCYCNDKPFAKLVLHHEWGGRIAWEVVDWNDGEPKTITTVSDWAWTAFARAIESAEYADSVEFDKEEVTIQGWHQNLHAKRKHMNNHTEASA